tara:strand:- start:861 stop:2201 length:1341 start_codon:yes stop_codon:yes gene_type:complete
MEYTPQQLAEFLQFAVNYLKLNEEKIEFISDDLHLDPTKDKDIQKYIAIALAEHGDPQTATSTGISTNTPGDGGNSRGPWQIHIPTWESTLRTYEVFDKYDDIKEALDDPGLNALAAVIIAQQKTGDERTDGINNWQTVMNKSKTEAGTEIIEDDPYGIKSGKGQLYEFTDKYKPQIMTDTLGQEQQETQAIKDKVDSIERFKEDTMNMSLIKGKLLAAQEGNLFNSSEAFFHMVGGRMAQTSGSAINNTIQNSLSNVDVRNLSNSMALDLYSSLVNPYVAVGPEYGGLTAEGDTTNIMDKLQTQMFEDDAKYYDTKTKKIYSGSEINKKDALIRNAHYRRLKNSTSSDDLGNLMLTYQYILRNKNPYVKVDDSISSEVANNKEEDNRKELMNEYPQTNKYMKPDDNAGANFLDNFEKVLRINPQNGNKKVNNNVGNASRDFMRDR